MDDFWDQFEAPRRVVRKIDVPCEEPKPPCRPQFVRLGDLIDKGIETGLVVVQTLYAIAFWGVVSVVVILILLAVIAHA